MDCGHNTHLLFAQEMVAPMMFFPRPPENFRTQRRLVEVEPGVKCGTPSYGGLDEHFEDEWDFDYLVQTTLSHIISLLSLPVPPYQKELIHESPVSPTQIPSHQNINLP